MRIINITLLVVLVFTMSCNQNKSKNEIYSDSEKIFKKTIEIHDEVMPMMGDIMKLQTTLKERKEGTTDEKLINKINISLQNLENAHNAMMNWMRNVTPIPEIADGESALSELPSQEEMLKIQEKSLENVKKVKIAILESISEANNLISKL